MPAVLLQLARHKSISTTMKFYVSIRSDEVATGLWAQHESEYQKDGLGTVLGTSGQVEDQRNEQGA